MKRSLIILAVMLSVLTAAPSLALFGPPSDTWEGTVNYIQPTNFTLITSDAQMYRVMLTPEQKLPSEVQLGTPVRVVVIQADNGYWFLDHFEKIGL